LVGLDVRATIKVSFGVNFLRVQPTSKSKDKTMETLRKTDNLMDVFTVRPTIGVMRGFCQALVLSVALLVTHPADSADRKQTERQLQKLISERQYRGIHMGIKVYSLKTNEVVFDEAPNKKLKPASNVKLVTTLAALKYLGPDFKFKTKIYTDGKIEKGVLKGNLYFKGYGDPKLVSEQIWFMVNELRRFGFYRIDGNIVIDDSYFDDKRTVKNGDRKRGARAYDALLGAVSVNFNTTTIYVRPGKRVGAKPIVIIDPENYYMKTINRAKTVSSRKRMSLRVVRVPGKYDDTIVVSGNIPIGSKEKRFYRNISHPRNYAAAFFRRFLNERGIKIRGKNRFKKVPANARELFVYESRPLRIIVSDLNRISNNFIAEQILKTMAAELKGVPGTTDKGIDILGDFLKELGIRSHYKLVNGSGLSPKNVMTAAQFIEVLKYGYRSFEIFPEYIGSMGIVGVDGTVDKRLKGTIAQGRVRAKTGSLKGVAALSGYINTLSNETLAFSFLMNDPKNRNKLMKSLQDKMLLMLCQVE